MHGAWVVFMEPRLFIWIARTLLKSFVVDKLKLRETERERERLWQCCPRGTTVIHFNSHTPSDTLPQIIGSVTVAFLALACYSMVSQQPCSPLCWPVALVFVSGLSWASIKLSTPFLHGFYSQTCDSPEDKSYVGIWHLDAQVLMLLGSLPAHLPSL